MFYAKFSNVDGIINSKLHVVVKTKI